MSDFKIEQTKLTPRVALLKDGCEINIKGECLPEDARAFFKPILEWTEQIKSDSPPKITLNLDLPYFNSSSSKQLMKLFYLLEDYKEENEAVAIEVNWYYLEGDVLIFEKGEEFDELTELRFNIIKS
ncbi:MAG: DUF1987 domain-containing protein [Crocinitomix sp.]|nr:DUF1987 domain-containing protein [Crocinitomix sp.]